MTSKVTFMDIIENNNLNLAFDKEKIGVILIYITFLISLKFILIIKF